MDLVDERPSWFPVIGFSVFLFLLLYGYYGAPMDAILLNRVYALEATILVSAAFLIGPLSRFWPAFFDSFKRFRRPLGLLGVFFAFSHVFTALVPLSTTPASLRFLAAAGSLLIFSIMVLASTRYALARLDYPTWKRIHQFGYVGLALLGAHLASVLFRDGRPPVLPEWFALGLVVLALGLRLAAFLAGTPAKTSYPEHVIPYQELAKRHAIRRILKNATGRRKRRAILPA